jgi:protein-disulfide isomerase
MHPVRVPADSTNNPSSDPLSQLLLPIQPEDHVEGNPHARYTLVEYGDYECPACGSLFQTIRQLHAQFGDDVRLVFRHYPLSGIHPHAEQAAEASEAAAAQGKDLYKYSEQLKLDSKRFRDELKDHKYEDRVREDFRRGVANGVYGTPGLFVNGIRHNGGLDVASIIAKLKEVSP